MSHFYCAVKSHYIREQHPQQITNKLKNISGKELINKFNKAKPEIIASIINEHQQKVKELNSVITNLRTYQVLFEM